MKSAQKISFLIPTLGRPEGLKRCLESIKKLNYPQELIEVLVVEDEPRQGVPKRVKELALRATGDWMVYASNDTEFTPDSLTTAINEGDTGFVAFNTDIARPDEGTICEHFMIRRDLVERLNYEIFDCDFYHQGCDNYLWEQMKKWGVAKHSNDAKVIHYHFSRGAEFDPVYQLTWGDKTKIQHDRDLLKKKLEKLYAK